MNAPNLACCKDCGHSVGVSARHCPQCGAQDPTDQNGRFTLFITAIVVAVILFFVVRGVWSTWP